ncbi:BsuPI-related putative proteinase inhibitor [Bacillus salitolerans]|uniref:SLH domain-containing protein n=1 Tax=Bacillus salitolerans TaxID=1437434 RepID=A0ABW4LPD2_9BACI
MKKLGIGLLSIMLLGSVTAPASASVDGNCDKGEELTCLEVKMTVEEKFEFLKELGIFQGKADGKSYLEENMTRAQLAVVLDRMFQLTDLYQGVSFEDTNNHWAENEIGAAVEAGFIKVSEDGNFNPNDTVSIEELAFALVSALEINFIYIYRPLENSSLEYAQFVVTALGEGLLEEAEDYREAALRSDFVQVMYQAYNYKKEADSGIVAGSIEPSVNVTKLDSGGYEFEFTFTNQTETEQSLIFHGGQRFEYEIFKDGEKIYHYSADKSFTMEIAEIIVKQGESLTYTDTLLDLEDGTYTMNYWLTADQESRGTVTFE